MRPLLAALVLATMAAGPAAAGPSRPQALAALDDPDATERRQAAAALAAVGTMQDVPRLVRALRDPDAEVRALAERALWEVWSRSGDDEVDALLALGVEQMNARRGEAAVETFSEVIRRRPDFAEGWNKRATAYYLLGEYDRSRADCAEVLERNPWHFGALAGQGLIALEAEEPEQALLWFERALAVNPNLRGVEEIVTQLRRLLIERRRHAA